MRASTVVGKVQRIASPTDNEREIPCRHERSGFRVCRVPGITFASVLIVSQDCIVNLGFWESHGCASRRVDRVGGVLSLC